MKNQSQQKIIRMITQTALFIGLALVVRMFSISVYFFGIMGMRIGFAGIFSKLPALIFGPFMGGIAGGAIDILGYVIKPEGAYIPLITLTAILESVLAGLLWKGLKDTDTKKLQVALWIIFVSIGIIGGINMISTTYYPDSAISQALDSVGKNKDFFALGLVVVAGTGILLLLIDLIVRKRYPQAKVHRNYIKLLITMGVASLTVTVLNTWILQLFFPELGAMAFVVFLVPRVVKEIFTIVIQSYIAAFLLSIYDRIIGPSHS